MSRKYVLFLNVLFLFAVVATLAMINQPLVPEVVGFAAVYIGILVPAVLGHWLLRGRGLSTRGVYSFATALCGLVAFALLGHLGWGYLAALLMIFSFGAVKKTPPAPAPDEWPNNWAQHPG